MKRPLTRPLIATIAVLVATAATPPAYAAFPGRNGVIAFVDVENGIGERMVVAIYPRSRRLRTLVRGLPEQPEFSPEGRLLAFRRDAQWVADGSDAATRVPPDIWIRSTTGRRLPRPMIPKPPGTDFHAFPGRTAHLGDADPDWSPDGQSLVFERAVIDQKVLTGQEWAAHPTVRIYHRGHSRAVTSGDQPTWSVLDEIAFVRWRRDSDDNPGVPGEPWIYVSRLDGSAARRVARGSEPDWSPDGRRLAFTTVDKHVATISRTGRRLRRVTRRHHCEDESPVFSPGGGQLAFVRGSGFLRCPNTSEGQDVVAARTDGRHLRHLLTEVQYWGDGLDWQPLRPPR